MELNTIEFAKIEDVAREAGVDAIRELEDMQLVLIGGGCEVSFN